MTVVEIKGIDKLKHKLEQIEPALKRGIFAATFHVSGAIAQYPPATNANSPRSFNSVYSLTTHKPQNTWYQRGYGSKWARKDGSIGENKSSKQLGQQWTMSVELGGLRGVVGNSVSYAPYVQGEKTQARGLAAIGWKHTGTVAEEEKDTVQGFIQSEVDKELAK